MTARSLSSRAGSTRRPSSSRSAHGLPIAMWNANFPRFSSRRKAYSWLGNRMGLKEGKCHIAMFDDDRCKKAIFAVEEFLK